MSERLRQLINDQPKVKVAQQSRTVDMDKVRFTALALFFAGVFYFFGYYFFWSTGGAF